MRDRFYNVKYARARRKGTEGSVRGKKYEGIDGKGLKVGWRVIHYAVEIRPRE